MNMPGWTSAFRWAVPSLLALGIAAANACAPDAQALGQVPKTAPPGHPPASGGAADGDVAPVDTHAQEIALLRDKVAALEAALAGRRPAGARAGGGMPMGDDGEEMSPMAGGPGAAQDNLIAARYRECLSCHRTRPTGALPASHLAASGGMASGMAGEMGMKRGMAAMGMPDDEMMGMGAMGRAGDGAMGPMRMESDLPGFPGASHLYHIGAGGFFLDHGAHITLTAEERRQLNGLKEKAILGGSSCARKVEEAEQEL